jgi:hypothetical protein
MSSDYPHEDPETVGYIALGQASAVEAVAGGTRARATAALQGDPKDLLPLCPSTASEGGVSQWTPARSSGSCRRT